MKETWRWFGPMDLVSIDDILQAGAAGVVSALHHVPAGAAWTTAEISKRQAEIAKTGDGSPSGLRWEVVESLPVSEEIKKQTGAWRDHISAYKESLHALAEAGLEVICYNFMPVLDWTRTDLAWRLSNGATCMRFDLTVFAAFDLYILQRPGAAEEYPEDVRETATKAYADMTSDDKAAVARNVVFGLPGAAESYSLADVRAHLAEYIGMTEETLRSHLVDFLSEIVPLAERLGLRLCCHPDDPPFPLLGLPRVMSTEAQYRKVMEEVPSAANGITLCSGSLGARPDNDLPGMMERLGDRVHFLHLRNVRRETPQTRGSFHEADHLGGDIDMVALIASVLREEKRRRVAGRSDHIIPMRPDHGQDILDDLNRKAQPGYPSIGRLKGLAELRGITRALEHHGLGLKA